jgi:hypothetical protein
MGGLYFYFGIILITSKNIKEFFQFQRGIYPDVLEGTE